MLFSIILLVAFVVTPALADNPYNQLSNSAAESKSQSQVSFGDINSGNTNQSGDIPRYFAPAGEMNYPNAPGIFTPADKDADYMNALKVKDLLEYDEYGLTTRAQKNILSSYSGGKRVMVRPKYGIMPEEKRLSLDSPMGVVFNKIPGMQSMGTITILSDSLKSITPDVFAEIQVEAWKLGGVVMHIKAEGFHLEVHNEGAGIGITWTGSTISGGEASAFTGVVGAGKTWGQVGYYKHPYIVIHVLRPLAAK